MAGQPHPNICPEQATALPERDTLEALKCGRVVQATGPLQVAILCGLDVPDTRFAIVPPRPLTITKVNANRALAGLLGRERSAPIQGQVSTFWEERTRR